MTEVVIGAVVVVVRQVTALAALWLRLSMQLRAERLRRETLPIRANRHPAIGREREQSEGRHALGGSDTLYSVAVVGHE
ncbi:MAG: hypothetical protein ABIZ05_12610 [Pseudonocardiaceae bacterium]